MPTSETNVELVRFEAAGISQVQAATEHYAEKVAEAEARTRALAASVKDGSFGRYAERMEAAARAQERLTAAARNSVLARGLASGETLQHARVLAMHGRIQQQLRTRELQQRLSDPTIVKEAVLVRGEEQGRRRLQDQFDARVRNNVLDRDVASGAVGRQARDMAALNREYEKLARQARMQELVGEHGRWGAVLRENAAQVQTLKTTALVGYGLMTAGVLGFVRAGLAGTVESYRMELQMQRLSRQVAAIAAPALNVLSNTVGKIADRFHRLSGPQQDFLLKLGLVAVVGVPVLAFVGKLTAAVIALRAAYLSAAAAQALMGGGGALGAAGAAGTAAATARQGLSAGGAIAGTAVAAGGAAAGQLAAQQAAQRAGTQATAGAVGGAVAAGTAGAAAGGSRLAALGKTALRLAPPVAAAAAVGDAATGGYFDVLRKKGNNQLTSGLGALGAGAMNLLSQPLALFGEKTFGEHFREKAEKEGFRGKEGGHRNVSPLIVGEGDLGGNVSRIQEEVLKVTSATNDGKRAAELITEMGGLKEAIMQLAEIHKKQIEGKIDTGKSVAADALPYWIKKRLDG